MTKQEMITHLSKAVTLIRQVEEAMAKDKDINEQYQLDAGQARDICIDLGLTLRSLIEQKAKS